MIPLSKAVPGISLKYGIQTLTAEIMLAIAGFSGGFLVPSPQMPGVYYWLFYINPTHWAYGGIMNVLVSDIKFKCNRSSPLECQDSVGVIVLKKFGLHKISPYDSMAILLFMTCSCLIMSVLVLEVRNSNRRWMEILRDCLLLICQTLQQSTSNTNYISSDEDGEMLALDTFDSKQDSTTHINPSPSFRKKQNGNQEYSKYRDNIVKNKHECYHRRESTDKQVNTHSQTPTLEQRSPLSCIPSLLSWSKKKDRNSNMLSSSFCKKTSSVKLHFKPDDLKKTSTRRCSERIQSKMIRQSPSQDHVLLTGFEQYKDNISGPSTSFNDFKLSTEMETYSYNKPLLSETIIDVKKIHSNNFLLTNGKSNTKKQIMDKLKKKSKFSKFDEKGRWNEQRRNSKMKDTWSKYLDVNPKRHEVYCALFPYNDDQEVTLRRNCRGSQQRNESSAILNEKRKTLKIQLDELRQSFMEESAHEFNTACTPTSSLNFFQEVNKEISRKNKLNSNDTSSKVSIVDKERRLHGQLNESRLPDNNPNKIKYKKDIRNKNFDVGKEWPEVEGKNNAIFREIYEHDIVRSQFEQPRILVSSYEEMNMLHLDVDGKNITDDTISLKKTSLEKENEKHFDENVDSDFHVDRVDVNSCDLSDTEQVVDLSGDEKIDKYQVESSKSDFEDKLSHENYDEKKPAFHIKAHPSQNIKLFIPLDRLSNNSTHNSPTSPEKLFLPRTPTELKTFNKNNAMKSLLQNNSNKISQPLPIKNENRKTTRYSKRHIVIPNVFDSEYSTSSDEGNLLKTEEGFIIPEDTVSKILSNSPRTTKYLSDNEKQQEYLERVFKKENYLKSVSTRRSKRLSMSPLTVLHARSKGESRLGDEKIEFTKSRKAQGRSHDGFQHKKKLIRTKAARHLSNNSSSNESEEYHQN